MSSRRYSDADAWYESEELTRKGLKTELQRIALRTRTRPLRVILAAVVVTALLGWRIAHRTPLLECEVVLAMTEGSLAQKSTTAPITVEQLKEYVGTVLLSDDRLLKLVEQRNLFRNRATMGNEYALTQLRDSFAVEVWQNTFAYYDEDTPNPEHSARIGITVRDTDPDAAIGVARDLANIVIAASGERQRQGAIALAKDVAAMREGLERRIATLAAADVQKTADLRAATTANRQGAIAALKVELAEIQHEKNKLVERMATVQSSRDSMADKIAEAGLDVHVGIAEEHVPERAERGGFVLILVLSVVLVGTLVGFALVFGAFDARLHDLDDLTRLGIPVLGHVPGFPGDDVGALETRGALRRRVPFLLRWRSQR